MRVFRREQRLNRLSGCIVIPAQQRRNTLKKIALVLALALSAGATAEGGTCYYPKFKKAPVAVESPTIYLVLRNRPSRIDSWEARPCTARGFTAKEVKRLGFELPSASSSQHRE
jgi:hypothetical protein